MCAIRRQRGCECFKPEFAPHLLSLFNLTERHICVRMRFRSYRAGFELFDYILPRRQANHSPPITAEVQKMWIYTCTLYAFVV
jgi:hypothetical protein